MLKSPEIAKQHLIIFTRYPEPGKTKTRLIAVLGTESAAELQRQMTEHTLFQVQQLQKTTAVSVEVRFAGGNIELMQNWLGTDLVYQSQGEGDLGKRMERSLLNAFVAGAQYVVIIGTDCPGVNAQILAKAFVELQKCDLVLGPAIDGGYYLIGLRRLVPELFININWGTAQVLQQTVDIAHQLNLSIVYLPTLADVDRPEDLLIWEKAIGGE
ncbi:MAG: TIGR04282 family arsenosugar biosynthesis glycosyltransferase [Fischerella sp.]|uniref:TIGR04282 family arsenosugar biosynthesis glycosyltransferase n=1 Tax=Fischerella sp. TaxID=1191 RepID=UPI001842CE60|nr:TIGR04282 family arsenosugar biosynthesis glycosyltransferase [Fischerella sp.]NWF57999.1 TIGR04282 family arsenosugar biosynthesis glycosyltransferase [Fischerella sp.]